MKRILILLSVLSVLSVCSPPAQAMASRNPNSKLTSEQLANLPDNANYVAGGESVDRAVTPEVLTKIAEITTADGQAVYGRYTAFGEDVAPDRPLVDSSALEAKNDIAGIVDKLNKSGSPQAAAALQALNPVVGMMKDWAAPVPQGDRKGGSQLSFMKGDSADVAQVAKNDADQLAAMRLRQQARANAAQTITRTEKVEFTDIAVSNIVAGVTALGEMYFSTEALRIAAEENETAIDPVTSAPIPTPVVDNGDGTISATSQEGDQNLLVKPVGNNGGIVILLPAKFNNTITSVTLAGKPLKFSAVANGNRSHWRGDKCSTYGDNAKLVFVSSGTPITVNVASPCTRWQTTVAKPVSASSIMPESPAASTNSTGVAAAPGE